MADVLTTTGTIPQVLSTYYVKKALETAEPLLVVSSLSKKVPLPKGNGKLVKWHRYTKVNSSTSPLTEATVPESIGLTASSVEATALQYGQFIKISDLLSFTAIDSVIEEASKRIGAAAAETVEDLCIAELDSAAFVQRVNNRASDNAIVAGDVLNHKEVIEAIIRMRADKIGAHESGSFIVVLHPLSQYDLLTDTSVGAFIDLNKYANPEEIMKGEIGKMYGAKFLVSDKMTSALNSEDVRVVKNYVIGREAFGTVSIDSQNFQVFIKPHGSSGVADPLNQIATVGYKLMGFVCKYLESGSKRVTQIRCSSSLGQ